MKYECVKEFTPAPGDILLSGRQEVGDGQGNFCVRDLWERPDGSRVSVTLTPWQEVRKQPVTR